MTTWTNTTKDTASWSDTSKSSSAASSIATGTPIGLLLVLTYAADVVLSAGSTWTNQTKS